MSTGTECCGGDSAIGTQQSRGEAFEITSVDDTHYIAASANESFPTRVTY